MSRSIVSYSRLGALALGVVAAVLGCAAVEEASEPDGSAEPVRFPPLVVTESVEVDPDDPAVWVDRREPAASLVLGTDKGGHLFVFDLQGRILRDLSVSGLGRMNNVDVEYGLALEGRTVDIAVATDRTANALRIYRLPDMKDLAPGGLPVFEGEAPELRLAMGVALYRRPADGAIFAFVSRKEGPSGRLVWQYLLRDDGGGRLEAVKVRELGRLTEGSEIEALAVDDELGFLYCSDEATGIRKYAADPDSPDGDRELALFGTEGFAEDREGISIYPTAPGRGFLLVSDQQADLFRVFPREGAPNAPHRHPEITSLALSTRESDGSEAIAKPLGRRFPEGLFVAMSDDGSFQLYSWRDLGLGDSPGGSARAAPNLLSGHPARHGDDGLHVVIEIPAGGNQKWEVTKSGDDLVWELEDGRRRVVRYLPYPANYGMVPRTLLPEDEGGDGDPLDVVLLGPALPRGAVVPGRAIGVLRLVDDGERDDKILAVPVEGPLSEVASLAELDRAYPGASEILELWFANYKGSGRMRSDGLADREVALRIIERAAAAYEARQKPGD